MGSGGAMIGGGCEAFVELRAPRPQLPQHLAPRRRSTRGSVPLARGPRLGRSGGRFRAEPDAPAQWGHGRPGTRGQQRVAVRREGSPGETIVARTEETTTRGPRTTVRRRTQPSRIRTDPSFAIEVAAELAVGLFASIAATLTSGARSGSLRLAEAGSTAAGAPAALPKPRIGRDWWMIAGPCCNGSRCAHQTSHRRRVGFSRPAADVSAGPSRPLSPQAIHRCGWLAARCALPDPPSA